MFASDEISSESAWRCLMALLYSLSYSVCILYSYLDVESEEGVDPLSTGECQFCKFILVIREMIGRVNIFNQSVLGSQRLSWSERKPNGMWSAVTA